MPKYEVTAPDGQKFDVNAPAGATEQDAIAYVQKQFYGAKQVDMPEPEKGFGQSLGEGIADIPRQIGLTARHGIEGGLGAVGMLSDPIAALMGLPRAEQTGKAIADKIGLPSPQTKIERIAAEPTKLLAGGAGLLKGAQAVSRLPGLAGEVGGLLAANPAQQMQAATGAGLAGGYTKETGGGPVSQGVAALAGGIAAPSLVGAVRGIPSAAKGVVEYLAPGISKPAAMPEVDVVITGLLKDIGLTVKDVSTSVLNQLRSDVSQAMKVSGKLEPDAARRLLDYRMVGATPTRAGLTLDPGDVTRQKNLSKLGMNSADPKLQQLGQIDNANNRTLIAGLNTLGATGDDAIAGALKVMGALSRVDDAAKSTINSAYSTARATGGRSAALDPSAFTQRANDLLDDALLGGKLPGDVRNLLNKAAAGEMPLTVDVAEQFKTRIGDLQRATNDMAERKALGLVRQALDDAPLLEGQGQAAIDAFTKARTLNRKYMSVVDRVPALQAVRDGIEPDKFVQEFIIGNGGKASVMDVAKLKAVIKGSPEALSAIRGQMLTHLKDKALNGASDEIGSFSQSAFNKAIDNIGERKLRLFFDKQELAQIKAIARVASYEQVQPRGSAVNNSNTAGTAMAALFDRLANSPIVGKIPMGPQFAGNVSASLNARRALNAPKAIAAPGQGSKAYPLLLPAMAEAGLLGP